MQGLKQLKANCETNLILATVVEEIAGVAKKLRIGNWVSAVSLQAEHVGALQLNDEVLVAHTEKGYFILAVVLAPNRKATPTITQFDEQEWGMVCGELSLRFDENGSLSLNTPQATLKLDLNGCLQVISKTQQFTAQEIRLN